MIAYSIRDGRLVFKVQVVPRASRSEVVGEHDGSLRVRIAAPPAEGAANKALIQILAQTFKVSRGAVVIMTGHSGRLKQVSIEGVPKTLLESVSLPFGAPKTKAGSG